MTKGTTYSFGPFTLDSGRRVLTRGDARVWVQERQLHVLLALIANAGEVVGKEDLIKAAWDGAAVTDNSIVQVVLRLRQTLRIHSGGEEHIETVPREGYRFVAPVKRTQPEAVRADLDSLLSPYLAFTESRAAIETLAVPDVQRARQILGGSLRADRTFDGALTALATATLLGFESTRVDANPAADLLTATEDHAREACRLNPQSGHAWATLAVVRHRRGDSREALAAARKAVTLEPDAWLHHLRLAMVSWGEERLRSARRTLTECPGVAFGHWFAATVYVARGMLDRALDEARQGCALQDSNKAARIPAVGLHWLHGLLLDTLGDEEEALAEFRRELAFGDVQHVYAREATANSWYAVGAISLRHGKHEAAARAFDEALIRVPSHRRALAAQGRTSRAPEPPAHEGAIDDVDAALDVGVFLALQHRHEDAARVCRTALEQAAPGSFGWLLPIEPILRPTSRPGVWASTLATLRDRAR